MTAKSSTNNSDKIRLAALDLLRAGLASPSEAAAVAGVSRQLVRFWLNETPINWRKARAIELRRAWRAALRP